MGAHRPRTIYLVLGLLLCIPARGGAACDEAGARRAAAAFAQAVGVDRAKTPEVAKAGSFWAVKYGRMSIFVDESDGSVVHAEDEWADRPSPWGASPPDAPHRRWAVRRAAAVARAMGVEEGNARLVLSGPKQSGRWAFRWARQADGVPYEMDGATVWLGGRDGRLLMADKSFWSEPPASTRASLSQAAAADRARRQARAALLSEAKLAAWAELRIVQPDSHRPGMRAPWWERRGRPAPRLSSRLAWAVFFGAPVSTAPASKIIWVDAQTGEILSGPGAPLGGPASGAGLAPAARLALAVAAFVVLMLGSALISSRWLGRRAQGTA